MITFRTMRREDVPAGLSLCRAAGWNQLSRDWELFLNISPESCRVAIDDEGKVVGTVTTVCYEKHFCWIGMVLVDPANRRQGIGMQLLKESIRILDNENTVKLDATPAGREVYLKLDFKDEYYLSRMLCTSVSAVPKELRLARPMSSLDFPKLLKRDQQAFGANRERVLMWIWNGAPEYAFVVEEANKVKGYCLGRHGQNYAHIGPVVAEDITVAKQLVSAVLHNCQEQSVIIDAPHHSSEWLVWLEHNGFEEQRPFMRMFLGKNKWPGKPEFQFAILGPELG